MDRGGHRRAAARQRLEPRQELPEVEGLGEVIVGAGFEAPHPVVDGVERRQHENRRGHPVIPQAPAEIEPRAARQPDVEHHHVEVRVLSPREPIGERGGQHRIDTVLPEALAE